MKLWVKKALWMSMFLVVICLIILAFIGFEKWNINKWIVLGFGIFILAGIGHCYKNFVGQNIIPKVDGGNKCPANNVNTSNFNSSWCNGNKISNSYVRLVHPDKNTGCTDRAKNLFNGITSRCERLAEEERRLAEEKRRAAVNRSSYFDKEKVDARFAKEFRENQRKAEYGKEGIDFSMNDVIGLFEIIGEGLVLAAGAVGTGLLFTGSMAWDGIKVVGDGLGYVASGLGESIDSAMKDFAQGIGN